MMGVSRLLRPLARFYPFQVGKGWVARLAIQDRDIPSGQVVRTKEGVMVRTRPDYMFKHAYLFGEFEPSNTAVFKALIRPGDVCFDVGACFGFYTCAFAKWGARVYAFEPLPSSFALNTETVHLNECQSAVKSFNCGLGERAGTLRVYTFKNLSAGHASLSDLGRDDAVPHECPITTLDDFCTGQGIERISFLKMDVEGFEYEVLRGGQKILSRADAPIVHFEVNATCVRHRNLDPNNIVSLLKSYGYVEFVQIGRYGGWRKAPGTLPVADYDYVAFKEGNRDRLTRR